jgi:hypothetical protein
MSPSDERHTKTRPISVPPDQTRADQTRTDQTRPDQARVDRGPVAGGGEASPRAAEALAGRRSLSGWATTAVLAAVLVVALAVSFSLVTGAMDRLNPFRNGLIQQRTVDRSGPAVLKAISDLGEFHAASGYYELVVDVEHDVRPVPSFLAGERVLFVAAGTVDVAVDLRGLNSKGIAVNAERTSATITLPKPRLTEPRVDLQRSYIYQRQRGLVNRLKDAVGQNSTDQRALYTLAAQRLSQAAQQTDELTTRGETNTRAMLQGLLRSLGFTDVTVNFAN